MTPIDRQRVGLVVIASLAFAVSCTLATSCTDETLGDPEPCTGGAELVVDGELFCVYESSIVIETGFECPEDYPYRFEGDGVTVCSASPEPPAGIADEPLPAGEPDSQGDSAGNATGNLPQGGSCPADKGCTPSGASVDGDDEGDLAEAEDDDDDLEEHDDDEADDDEADDD